MYGVYQDYISDQLLRKVARFTRKLNPISQQYTRDNVATVSIQDIATYADFDGFISHHSPIYIVKDNILYPKAFFP